MSAGLLEIQPRELKFVFELKKQSSCFVRLVNKSNDHVAFKIKTTSPKKYSVRPNTGVIKPKSACDFTVTMQAQKLAPPDMICKDRFLVQSTVVPAGTKDEDVDPGMFAKDFSRYVEENKMRVILVSPPNSPVLSPINGTLKHVPAYEDSILKDQVLRKLESFTPRHTVTKDVEAKMENSKEVKPAKGVVYKTMKDMEEPAKDVEYKTMKDVEDQAKDVDYKTLKDMEEPAKHVEYKTRKDVQEQPKDVDYKIMEDVGEQVKDADYMAMNDVEEQAKDVDCKAMKDDQELAKVVESKTMKDEEEPAKEVEYETMKDEKEPAKEVYHAKEVEYKPMKGVEELQLVKDIEDMKSKLNELESKLSEAEVTISKLTEERRWIAQEGESFRQELALLRSKSGAIEVQVGFPFLFVCMVSFISIMLGYLLNR
ncbi:Vesicle-associated protein 2-2 [Camellia lanceoleosa]|uniref:Vesicle-associated protein 2-2 n=1 Tax=Camellia lanceoleosa TaxID=1840588 RepID=A0ACC0IJZ5_9ERIC|nr:Vesicle-associated protein 2-2 [Camellia lanceoleosa]